MSDIKQIWRKYEFSETDYQSKMYDIYLNDQGSYILEVGGYEDKILVDVLYTNEDKIVESLKEYEVDPSNPQLEIMNGYKWENN